ncbi:MAG: hypothetical protein DMG22_15660, partial [Acidobacteria bacterium]
MRRTCALPGIAGRARGARGRAALFCPVVIMPSSVLPPNANRLAVACRGVLGLRSGGRCSPAERAVGRVLCLLINGARPGGGPHLVPSEENVRAAISSMSNVAEGFARKTSRDFAHFLDVARGRSPRSSLCFTLLSTLDIFRPSILKSCSVWL